MRRSFFGSHRERVEAATAIQASRRRRRISLEVEEFERPGGRPPRTSGHVEESPEAALAALSMTEKPRRASIDCPWAVRLADVDESMGTSSNAFGADEDLFGYQGLDFSPWSQEQILLQQQQQQAAVVEQPKSSGSTPESSAPSAPPAPSDAISAPSAPATQQSRRLLASARRACASLVSKATHRSRDSSSGTAGKQTTPREATPSTQPEAPARGMCTTPEPWLAPERGLPSRSIAGAAASRFPDMMDTDMPAPAGRDVAGESAAFGGQWHAAELGSEPMPGELLAARRALIKESEGTRLLLPGLQRQGRT